jgi:putative ABC transport system substrate-binding protein
MNKRRRIVLALGTGVLVPFTTHAQGRTFRIAVLAAESLEARQPLLDIFVRAMRDLGYVEGKNAAFDARYANNDTTRLDALAAELVAQTPDVIVVPNGVAVLAAAKAVAQANRTTPIVFAGWASPLGSGLVASLARPGGNVTGLSNIAVELAAKQLQLLKEAVPKSARVVVFVDSATSSANDFFSAVARAAKALGVQLMSAELRKEDEAETTIALIRKWGADSIYVQNNPTNFNNRRVLVQIAEKTRLPAIYGNNVYTNIGGLISYSSDDKLRWRQTATYVDKILKGAKPGDLPIELPSKFELVINLKTAKTLGIKFPQSIMVQATLVIE